MSRKFLVEIGEEDLRKMVEYVQEMAGFEPCEMSVELTLQELLGGEWLDYERADIKVVEVENVDLPGKVIYILEKR